MIAENILLGLMVIFFLATLAINIFTVRFFKKHESNYLEIISEYRKRGYDLDALTNLSSFFGSLFCYFKIIWFVRLYKNIDMKYTSERRVQPEAYEFVQTLPPKEIEWMLKLHRMCLLQFFMLTLLCIDILMLYLLKNIGLSVR
ncbi:hypothetical protein [Phytobacter sp. V91]|uniref:hypothetical protein n=1 Tax=Phytobacter sp. V91 TaxID=3369425 RepID=UPI003F5DCCA0